MIVVKIMFAAMAMFWIILLLLSALAPGLTTQVPHFNLALFGTGIIAIVIGLIAVKMNKGSFRKNTTPFSQVILSLFSVCYIMLSIVWWVTPSAYGKNFETYTPLMISIGMALAHQLILTINPDYTKSNALATSRLGLN